MKDIAVEYLGGSGFLVSLGDIGLLFDASEHGGDARILPEQERLAAYRRLYVFISHRHDDHFSESIYSLCGSEAIYIGDIHREGDALRQRRHLRGVVDMHARLVRPAD